VVAGVIVNPRRRKIVRVVGVPPVGGANQNHRRECDGSGSHEAAGPPEQAQHRLLTLDTLYRAVKSLYFGHMFISLVFDIAFVIWPRLMTTYGGF
jgi:hypothetical protein